MHKKLIAAAVAGAFIAPAAALAQTSTVNIYGKFTYEYGWADQGNGRPSVDYADTPGGSAIGFRGEEKLGGNLSAWFQCESSADVRGMDQTGWCTRNSAVGFKGGFGNVFFGRWDTPLKRAMNVGTVGAEETGILGMSFLPFGGSGGASAAPAGTNATDLGIETQQRQRFKRREAGLAYYESPNFSGFMVMGAFSAGNFAADAPAVDCTAIAPTACTNDKPRIWSIAGTYAAGPFGIGVGYEKHMEFGVMGSAVNLDDRGWGISAAYTFGGNIKVGGTYLDRKFETAAGREVKGRTWTIGVDWAIAGPHSVSAQYARANDSKGNSLTGIGGNGGVAAPHVIVGGVETSRGDTGGDAFSIAYSYAFSKRTRVKFGYVRVDNESNANIARIGNTAALIAGSSTTANGQNVDGFAGHISHTF